MSDRICQFFLRGRCHRENCEFKHDPEKVAEKMKETSSTICRFYERGNCKFKDRCRFKHEKPEASSSDLPEEGPISLRKPEISDKKAAGESDDDLESIGSGFTEVPKSKSNGATAKPLTEQAKTQVEVKPASSEPEKANETVSSPAPVTETTPEPVAVQNVQPEASDNNPEEPNEPEAVETAEVVEEPLKDNEEATDSTVAAADEPMATEESSASAEVDQANEEATQEKSETASAATETPKGNLETQPIPEKAPSEQSEPKGKETIDDYFSDSSPEKTPKPKSKEQSKDADVSMVSVPETSNDDVEQMVRTPRPPKPVEAEEEQPSPSKTSEKATSDAPSQEVESIESINAFIQNYQEEPEKSKEKETKGEKSKKSADASVEEIFGDDGKTEAQKKVDAAKRKSSALYDIDLEDFGGDEATPFVTKTASRIDKKRASGRKDGVTKIGNNTYFYAGPKGKAKAEAESEELEDDPDIDMDEGPVGAEEEENIDGDQAVFISNVGTAREDDDDSMMGDTSSTTSTPKRGKSYRDGRRKHRTNYVYGGKSTAAKLRRCGECEGCSREDCGECEGCKDKPKFGGKNLKKQACYHRECVWKKSQKPSTPGRGRGRGRGRRSLNSSTRDTPTPVKQEQEPSENEKNYNRAKYETKESSSNQDTPRASRRGGRKSIAVISPAAIGKDKSDYFVIQPGVNLGLSGSYWNSSTPERRSRRSAASSAAPTPEPEESSKSKAASTKDSPPETAPARRGRGRPPKRKTEDDAEEPSSKRTRSPTGTAEAEANDEPNVVHSDYDKKSADDMERAARRFGSNSNAATEAAEEIAAAVESANAQEAKLSSKPPRSLTQSLKEDAPNAPQQNRNVSCVSDTATQREVVVECFAPYDDHRWVNIGKERDGMTPDAVQYARALRPPYHLLSFLRIKGYSTKGMSCTDKNTMVFVVLEGEITVVLHTTQFVAKKGDSFYIPPKNYYNLINQKVREAELSLIQFQYDGPLPTVSAGSQSGKANA